MKFAGPEHSSKTATAPGKESTTPSETTPTTAKHSESTKWTSSGEY